jgi:YD repeat-containing protein
MRKNILFIMVLLYNVLVFGQETPGYQVPNFAPKTPEAASFLKYGEYPVNLSTGLPSISIPLYSIDLGDYKLPISLDYHASGIKVTQEATWVGLGWNLNFGAQIILSVRDGVDENNAYIDTIPDDEAISVDWELHPYSFNSGIISTLNLDESRVKDVYSFSSPTANGTFYIRNFANNDVVVFPPDGSFKVELLGGNRSNMGFRVIDSHGNEYLFNNTKEVSARTMSHSDYYISAWHVDKIKTATNKEINFLYENDGSSNDYSFSQRVEVKKIGIDACSIEELIQQKVSSVIDEGSSTYTLAKKIKEIIFNEGASKVVFERVNQRDDLMYSSTRSYLNLLLIKQLENENFVIKKGFDFNYSYFTSINNENNIEYKNKRLKLDEVVDMIDGSGNTFVYSNANLPSKISKSEDYFGYYNNKSNLNLIPIHFIRYPYSTLIGNADRSVNQNVNQAGMLTEIHYPTKGWTKFNYETNQYYGIDDFEKYSLVTINSNILTGTGRGLLNPSSFESPGIDDLPICNLANQNNCVQYREVFFTANNASGQFSFQVVTNGISQSEMHYKYARIRVVNNEGIEVYNSAKIQDNTTINFSFENWSSGKIIMESYSQYVSIQNLLMNYVNDSQTIKNLYGSGLRVKNIENYNHNNSLLLKKEYEYNDIVDATKSSGKLVNNLVTSFMSNSFNIVKLKNVDETELSCHPAVDYTSTYSISSDSRYGIEANSVVYNYVKEKQLNLANGSYNGYTLYKFTTDSDDIPLGNPTVQIYRPWKRGKIIEKKDYKTIGSTSYLLRKEVNNYFEDSSKIAYINGFKLFRHCTINFTTDSNNADDFCQFGILKGHCYVPNDVFEAYEIVTYDIPILWHYLKNTVVEELFYDSNNVFKGMLSNTKTYNYNNFVHLQLSSEVTTNSKQEITETKYFYPQDDALSGEPFMTNLIEKNIVGKPIKIQSLNNNTVLSEQKTIYNNWGNSLILPQSIQNSKGTISFFEDRVRFNAYDLLGNPLEFRQENGTIISYLWGYNKSQPIAKFENATNAQIKSALGVTDLNLVNETHLSDINALRLNASFADVMITTFTYFPLIGVSTITDPKGDKITYNYDGFGRLQNVKDKNGNILSENEYHYKN